MTSTQEAAIQKIMERMRRCSTGLGWVRTVVEQWADEIEAQLRSKT
jgi:hypothetical protein